MTKMKRVYTTPQLQMAEVKMQCLAASTSGIKTTKKPANPSYSVLSEDIVFGKNLKESENSKGF